MPHKFCPYCDAPLPKLTTSHRTQTGPGIARIEYGVCDCTVAQLSRAYDARRRHFERQAKRDWNKALGACIALMGGGFTLAGVAPLVAAPPLTGYGILLLIAGASFFALNVGATPETPSQRTPTALVPDNAPTLHPTRAPVLRGEK